MGGEVGVVMDMGVAMEVGAAMERLHDNPWGAGNVLYLDCINVKLQVVILFYSFTACYHQGNWGKGHRISLFIYYFLTFAYESIAVSKQKVSLKKSGKLFSLPDYMSINLIDVPGKR